MANNSLLKVIVSGLEITNQLLMWMRLKLARIILHHFTVVVSGEDKSIQ